MSRISIYSCDSCKKQVEGDKAYSARIAIVKVKTMTGGGTAPTVGPGSQSIHVCEDCLKKVKLSIKIDR